MDGGEEPRLDRLVGVADHRLERRDHVADHVFRRVVQQHAEPAGTIEARALARDDLDQQRMLGDGEDVRALGLAVPARHARETMGDVLDLDVERRGIEQVEPAPRQHALPRAERLGAHGRFRLRGHQRPASLANVACRWQVTTWSLTMPVACMKA